MEDTAALIRAIAALAWPLVVVFIVIRYDSQVRDLLGRIKRGKIAGAEIELSEKLDSLVASASEAASDADLLAAGAPAISAPVESGSSAERAIIDEVSRSPKAALLLLTSEIDRSVRLLLAALATTKRSLPFPRAIHELEQKGIVPKSVVEALTRFTDVRNRLVHGHHASDDDIIRAIDAGLVILRSVQAAPQPIAIVRHVGVPLYSDAAGTAARPDITGLIVEIESPGSVITERKILPTRSTKFQVGRRIGSAYSYERDYDDSLFRDPETGEMKQGWSYSKEFVGSHLEEM